MNDETKRRLVKIHSMKNKIKHPEFYRARVSCRVGADAIDRGTPVEGRDPMEYAIYNMLRAVEEIAAGLEKMEDRYEQRPDISGNTI